MVEQNFDFELVFDKSECGSSGGAYYALLTDYQSVTDILVRWPRKGITGYQDDAAELAEQKALELVKRWNSQPELLAIVKELMPYARAAIGLPRESWSWDNCILKAERALAKIGEAP